MQIKRDIWKFSGYNVYKLLYILDISMNNIRTIWTSRQRSNDDQMGKGIWKNPKKEVIMTNQCKQL